MKIDTFKKKYGLASNRWNQPVKNACDKGDKDDEERMSNTRAKNAAIGTKQLYDQLKKDSEFKRLAKRFQPYIDGTERRSSTASALESALKDHIDSIVSKLNIDVRPAQISDIVYRVSYGQMDKLTNKRAKNKRARNAWKWEDANDCESKSINPRVFKGSQNAKRGKNATVPDWAKEVIEDLQGSSVYATWKKEIAAEIAKGDDGEWQQVARDAEVAFFNYLQDADIDDSQIDQVIDFVMGDLTRFNSNSNSNSKCGKNRRSRNSKRATNALEISDKDFKELEANMRASIKEANGLKKRLYAIALEFEEFQQTAQSLSDSMKRSQLSDVGYSQMGQWLRALTALPVARNY